MKKAANAAFLFGGQRCAVSWPVKVGARISFAPGGDIRMSLNVLQRIVLLQELCQLAQPLVLGVGKSFEIRAFQFDANRKVIAALPVVPCGLAGVPGALAARYKLDQLAVASDQEMG